MTTSQETAHDNYYYGTGKRKTAIAQVRLYPGGQGQDQVNGKPLDQVFPWPIWQQTLREPLRATDTQSRFTLSVKVKGGGVSSQADAIRHGIARALVVYDETLKPTLRHRGFLTRVWR